MRRRSEGRVMAGKPKWWHEKASARRKQLDAAVERLRDALPSFAGVRGAYVFGSYARGQSGPDSDLDILLVRSIDSTGGRRDDDVRAKLRLGVPYDLVTVTPQQLQLVAKNGGFFEDAVKEGIWIDATRAD